MEGLKCFASGVVVTIRRRLTAASFADSRLRGGVRDAAPLRQQALAFAGTVARRWRIPSYLVIRPRAIGGN